MVGYCWFGFVLAICSLFGWVFCSGSCGLYTSLVAIYCFAVICVVWAASLLVVIVKVLVDLFWCLYWFCGLFGFWMWLLGVWLWVVWLLTLVVWCLCLCIGFGFWLFVERVVLLLLCLVLCDGCLIVLFRLDCVFDTYG